ncbi:MAG: SLBB domain-containing protein [Myxococcales bacterium]|nr:SLBB domain-containing protein [Myxococcales bacterium]
MAFRRVLVPFALSLGLVVGAGCGASLPKVPQAPTAKQTKGGKAVAGAPGVDHDPPQGLRLYPGDVISPRRIAAETVEEKGLTVDELGNLHVPLAGDVRVAGLDLSTAEQAVEEALRRFDKLVRVALVLEAPNGQKATVIGAVTTPGRVPITPGTRVADLLAAAGGTLNNATGSESVPLADLENARLIRNGKAIPISVARAVEGELRHNVYVRPGDQLHVPAFGGARVSVIGELRNGQPVPFRPGLRLTEALSINSGVTIDGDRGDIRIVRGPAANPTVYEADLKAIMDGETPDVELAAGDVVYVTDHWLADVGEVLGRFNPVISIALTAASISTTIYIANIAGQ